MREVQTDMNRLHHIDGVKFEPGEFDAILLGQSDGEFVILRVKRGQEPNWFHRLMQRLCFGVRWRRVEP